MALAVLFDVPGMTREQYDDVIRDLEAADAEPPAGRISHVAVPRAGGWFVLDVWEAQEDLDRFVSVLMPALGKVGLTPPRPEVQPVHRFRGAYTERSA
jgi:hypothetical protein